MFGLMAVNQTDNVKNIMIVNNSNKDRVMMKLNRHHTIKEFNVGQSVIKSASPNFCVWSWVGGGKDRQSTFHSPHEFSNF